MDWTGSLIYQTVSGVLRNYYQKMESSIHRKMIFNRLEECFLPFFRFLFNFHLHKI